ncbi:MAG TPA: exodeoxyribonuclease VII large subunit [bacterium]|nr:exodeoxyribonuclease VII large subunit [bacterium]
MTTTWPTPALVYTVTELTRMVRNNLEADPLLGNIWVRGEIGTFKRHASGHVYFTLKDCDTLLRCVMFRSFARRLRFDAESGLEVLVFGEVSVYERDGSYQLYARELQPDGIGAQYLALQQLKECLTQEGLFALERKRPIPPFPERVAVVTSAAGAALQDILAVARRRFAGVEIFLCPVLVQGREASAQIISALKKLNKTEHLDVLIVARGGGSKEDLSVFNDERVVRQIAASRAPVVSAVGHETDHTLTDLAADVRAPTPSAAAELVFPDVKQIEKELFYFSQRFDEALKRCLHRHYEVINGVLERKPWREPVLLLDNRRHQLKRVKASLQHYKTQFTIDRRAVLAGIRWALLALDPAAVMERGFTVIQDPTSGQVVVRARQTRLGQYLKIRFADGEIFARVTDFQGDENNE